MKIEEFTQFYNLDTIKGGGKIFTFYIKDPIINENLGMRSGDHEIQILNIIKKNNYYHV